MASKSGKSVKPRKSQTRAVAKTIRASESVAPYGPGAIVDILGQSFMMPTGDRWPAAKYREPVKSERLAQALGVDELWGAPTTHEPEDDSKPGLSLERFPGWLFCGACRRMVHWRRQMEQGALPQCVNDGCDGRLVPMRFVAVCTTRSHLDDIPWGQWLHRSAEGDCKSEDRLRFQNVENGGEGLRGLEVRCDWCGHRRTLGDLRRDALAKDGFTCRGKQPWESAWGDCGEPIDPQQRGATSLHFSDTMSAIEIPQVTSRADKLEDRVRSHVAFASLSALPEPTRQLVAEQIATDIGATIDEVLGLAGVGSRDGIDIRMTTTGLLAEEFEAFAAAIKGEGSTEDFKTRPKKPFVDGTTAVDGIAQLIDDIVLVDRVRDVRAVIGFRRYDPDAALVDAVPKHQAFEKSWLPAAAGYGEGIFVRFNPGRVMQWAAESRIEQRTDEVFRNQSGSKLGARLHVASSEYMLLHTFAHLLMRELAFTSGYTAASLRERVYCEAVGDYGVFIYTTTSDVEGTLGGLVRQGEPKALTASIVRALEQAVWCPNDPICVEAQAQSIDGLNLAACHACCLVSETSCESQNLLLDRALLVGGEGVPGFFAPVLDSILGQISSPS